MLTPPSLAPLIPQQHRLSNGNILYYFPNDNLDLVKLDFTVEAGSAYQQLKSQAHAANQLFGEATTLHDAPTIAEFLDFRGIVVERMTDTCQGNISYYFLRKYADELFPLLREMFDHPEVTPQLFEAYVAQRRQKIAMGFQQTNYVARNRFYELLYGFDHPLGCYATVSDLDLLTLDSVYQFLRRHYSLAHAHIVLAGHVDEDLLTLADRYFSPEAPTGEHPVRLQLPAPAPVVSAEVSPAVLMPSAVQSSLRIGRVLPMAWHDPHYAQFMVLSTVLGGYFGSRLMSNIREDKGYTYGIYSQTQVFRDSIVFFITAEVAAHATQPAVQEVMCEIDRLQQQPIPEEELERVRNVMMGDFIRSIDGTFELSERYRQMYFTDVTEQLTTNYFDAVQHVTPAQLQALAQHLLTDLTTVTAGPAAVQ